MLGYETTMMLPQRDDDDVLEKTTTTLGDERTLFKKKKKKNNHSVVACHNMALAKNLEMQLRHPRRLLAVFLLGPLWGYRRTRSRVWYSLYGASTEMEERGIYLHILSKHCATDCHGAYISQILPDSNIRDKQGKFEFSLSQNLRILG